MSAPSFVFAGPSGVLIGEGVQTGFATIAGARAALTSGAADLVVGALPFDLTGPAALHAPASAAGRRRAARLADGHSTGAAYARDAAVG